MFLKVSHKVMNFSKNLKTMKKKSNEIIELKKKIQ